MSMQDEVRASYSLPASKIGYHQVIFGLTTQMLNFQLLKEVYIPPIMDCQHSTSRASPFYHHLLRQNFGLGASCPSVVVIKFRYRNEY